VEQPRPNHFDQGIEFRACSRQSTARVAVPCAQCDAELVQSLHGFANYVPIDAECLDEIALGRPPTRAVCPFGIRQTDTLRKHLSQGQDTVSS
jgi:hypothetical protein